MRTYQAGRVSAAKPAGGGGRSGAEHPLLMLQRTAGNQAVTAFVQRKAKGYHSSRVAIAPIDMIYDGKCDAVTQGAAVSKETSRGLLGKDVSIIFECGPKKFEFTAYHPYIGDRFPWDLELVDDGSAYVTEAISKGLDKIDDDISDSGSEFWDGYHAVQGLLAADLKEYCADQA